MRSSSNEHSRPPRAAQISAASLAVLASEAVEPLPLPGRLPQSRQSEPRLHELNSAPGPPSSQSPSLAYLHVLLQSGGGALPAFGHTEIPGPPLTLQQRTAAVLVRCGMLFSVRGRCIRVIKSDTRWLLWIDRRCGRRRRWVDAALAAVRAVATAASAATAAGGGASWRRRSAAWAEAVGMGVPRVAVATGQRGSKRMASRRLKVVVAGCRVGDLADRVAGGRFLQAVAAACRVPGR